MADAAVLLGDHEGHWREGSLGRRSAMTTRTPIGHDLLEQLASLDAVDGLAKPLAKAVRSIKAPAHVNEALSGTWLGHPVHPLLIVVPMGSWVSAVLLDWLGGKDAETAADLLVGVGLAGAVPTVATGYGDWADSEPASDTVRRIGLVHAAFNETAAGLFTASLAARVSGSRGRGKLLALAGLGSVAVGGYLGGHLTYAEGVGVNVDTFEEYPQDWTEALADAALGEGEMRAVDVAAGRSTRCRTHACTAAARWPTASSSATACSARSTARASGSRTARSSRARPPTRNRRSRRGCATARSRYARPSAPRGTPTRRR